MKLITAGLLMLSGGLVSSLVVARAEPETAMVVRGEPEAATAWNKAAAAKYLDGRIAWWKTWPTAARDQGTFCISCHTALPYALARPVLRSALNEKAPSADEKLLFDNVVKRVRLWKDVEPFYPDQTRGIPKTSQSRGTEAVLNALVLANRDAHDGSLTEDTRVAFGNLWALQMKTGELSGAWAWLHFSLEPWEGLDSPYYGAALAAVAVGTAPGGYASSPEIQESLTRLRDYLSKGLEQQPLLNRALLLLASTRLQLITPEQQDAIAAALLRAQRDDGGWATASLGAWKRTDGTPLESSSDGYATGLVTLALQALQPPDAASGSLELPLTAQVQKGRQWLVRHQNAATGGWSASSLNKQRDGAAPAAQFMSDAATGYAVLALTSTE
jgi:squalene-hopene/tetraprenyl-beta-curcumene cyclase